VRDRDLAVAGTVIAWVPVVLVLDAGWATAGTQWLLGLATWGLLLGLLLRETPVARAQVAVVVAYATLVEYTFSAGLHVYTYRLGGVPSFVPPGHGLVYLGALALGRSALFRARARWLIPAAIAAVTAYAGFGLSPLAPRPDVLGALWALCLVVFLLWGRAPLVYVGALLIVTWLELLGTGLGVWTWAARSPTGLIAQGNPPSGAAGGYCFFDAGAIALAPLLVRRTRVAAAT